ncbi:short integuments 2, mitochondrial isoform X1 [Selaginella moellendorffii]|nr:short integuments 2, mitochondrial isoform X1 [Selaginella moellendorffii]|eukprot:XP_024539637.1 short integuments 2, mitochondrial isoform X1 [Selaginella moellendorffii]
MVKKKKMEKLKIKSTMVEEGSTIKKERKILRKEKERRYRPCTLNLQELDFTLRGFRVLRFFVYGVMAAPAAKKLNLITKMALQTAGNAKVCWYPGHMVKAMRDIQQRFKYVDLVLEIRDARIPLSSANDELGEFISKKKHVIVMNKMDLASSNMIHNWKKYFEAQGQVPIYVNAHSKHSVHSMVVDIKERLAGAIQKEATLLVMIAGIPNVGKSVLTNALYQATVQGRPKKAQVGPLPGVTKIISGFKIGQCPSIYLLDTPGVLIPNIKSVETGLKLAITGAVKDSVIGEDRLARYLLALLNIRRPVFAKKLKPNARDYGHWEVKGCSPQERAVREAITSLMINFDGDLEDEDAMTELIDNQMYELRKTFRVPQSDGYEGYNKVARRLLQFYRGGKLGSYVWDILPEGA